MAGISSRAAGEMENRDALFQGQKFDADLELNWYQFKWRNHDPQIGRFVEIDPLGHEYVHNSTYSFSENKVTNHIELEGLEAVPAPGGNSSPGNPMYWIVKPIGDAMITAGNWFDRTFTFGTKSRVEISKTPGSNNSQSNLVVETTTETHTNIGGVLNTLKNSERPMTFDELPSLTQTKSTTKELAEKKVEITTPIIKSTTKGSVDNSGNTAVEQKAEINTRRGVTIGVIASRNSNNDSKIGAEGSVGNDNTKLRVGVTVTQNGSTTTVEFAAGGEKKIGNKRVSTSAFIRVNQ